MELRSQDLVKIVELMMISQMENSNPGKGNETRDMLDGASDEAAKTYCVSNIPRSRQQELVEASFRMRARIHEFNASSFAAIPLEAFSVRDGLRVCIVSAMGTRLF